jgi:hypothetical protein
MTTMNTRDYGKSHPRFAEGGEVRDPSSHRTPGQVHAMDHGYNVQHQDRIVMRHKARRTFMREGKVHKGDGLDVDHRDPLYKGGSNAPSNWRVRTAHANRGWAKKS